ncbi:MAG: bifunctional adenosylcobinamide kinase/adenosylcobinamide-phosphate guanylyltransferase, partial [Angelakisella sp.]
WVRARLDAGDDPLTALSNCLERYRDGVVVCEDISCGIVPLDPADRRWREATGRCGALVAAQADEVVRLFCGIPTRIK